MSSDYPNKFIITNDVKCLKIKLNNAGWFQKNKFHLHFYKNDQGLTVLRSFEKLQGANYCSVCVEFLGFLSDQTISQRSELIARIKGYLEFKHGVMKTFNEIIGE